MRAPEPKNRRVFLGSARRKFLVHDIALIAAMTGGRFLSALIDSNARFLMLYKKYVEAVFGENWVRI